MVLRVTRDKYKQAPTIQTAGSYLGLHSEPADTLQAQSGRFWLYSRYYARKRLVRDVRRRQLRTTRVA